MPLPDERLCGDWTYRQKSSARRAGELQCLGDMPWVSRATAMWPDNRYVASEGGSVNTREKFSSTRYTARVRCDTAIGPLTTRSLFSPGELASRTSRLL